MKKYWATFEQTAATRAILILADAGTEPKWDNMVRVELPRGKRGGAKPMRAHAEREAARLAAEKGGTVERFIEVRT